MERESHLIMKEIIKHKITHNVNRLKTSLKWVVFAILSGVLVGSVGTLFYLCMALVTLVRTKNPWLIFLLPVGGILIVGAYRLLHDERDTGTNLVLSAIHSGDELPLRMAPLIFISTLITHLFGGSAGREGAALQLGAGFQHHGSGGKPPLGGAVRGVLNAHRHGALARPELLLPGEKSEAKRS